LQVVFTADTVQTNLKPQRTSPQSLRVFDGSVLEEIKNSGLLEKKCERMRRRGARLYCVSFLFRLEFFNSQFSIIFLLKRH